MPIVDFLLDDVGTRAWRVVRPLVREGIVPRPDRPSYTIAMLAATRYGAPPPSSSPTIRASSTSRSGACSRSRAAARTASPTTRSSSATPGATSFRESGRPGPGDARAPARRQPRRAGPRLLDLSSRLVLPVPRVAGADRRRARPAHRCLPGTPPKPRRPDRVDGGRGPGQDRRRRAAAARRPARPDRPGPRRRAGRDGEGRVGPGRPGRWRFAGSRATGRHRRRRRRSPTPSADVQGAAIALIGRLVDGPDDAVARAVADRVPEVAASQRSAAASLAARLGGGDTERSCWRGRGRPCRRRCRCARRPSILPARSSR